MAYVLQGVLLLLGTERSARPIGVTLAAAHLVTQRRRHEVAVADRLSVPEEGTGNLGVGDPGRKRSGHPMKDVEIMGTGMDDDQRATHQCRPQRPEVGAAEWIDRRLDACDRHLHQAQLGAVGLLPEELGVKRHRRSGGKTRG